MANFEKLIDWLKSLNPLIVYVTLNLIWPEHTDRWSTLFLIYVLWRI